MKKFIPPEICEIKISDTAQDVFGWYWDGGYVGDGILGVLTWDPNEAVDPCNPTPKPSPGPNPSTSIS